MENDSRSVFRDLRYELSKAGIVPIKIDIQNGWYTGQRDLYNKIFICIDFETKADMHLFRVVGKPRPNYILDYKVEE